MHSAALYLIPVTLGDPPVDRVLPAYNNTIISGISHFIVENIRTARRFLKKSNPEINIDSLTFYTLNGHTRPEDVRQLPIPVRMSWRLLNEPDIR